MKWWRLSFHKICWVSKFWNNLKLKITFITTWILKLLQRLWNIKMYIVYILYVLCTFCISKNANWVFNTSASCRANVGAIDKYPNWPKPVLENWLLKNAFDWLLHCCFYFTNTLTDSFYNHFNRWLSRDAVASVWFQPL